MAGATTHSSGPSRRRSARSKYVRVTVHDPSTEGTFLNEIELYSNADSFENDAVGYVPRGYTNAVGATDTDTWTFHFRR